MKRSAAIVYSVLFASLFAAHPGATHAEMYKWINDDDTTTYSNQPPADPASARELTVIDSAAQPATAARVEIQPAEAPKLDGAARAAAVRPMLPPAVRDPCLMSSDRLCHQKNSGRYRPYVGYTGEVGVAEAPAVLPPPRGATSGASATGAVSGGGAAR